MTEQTFLLGSLTRRQILSKNKAKRKKKNYNQATLSKIIQLNDKISKRTAEDQLNYETEVFSSKKFRETQGFPKSVKKAPPYPSEMSNGQNRTTDDMNKTEICNQFFHNVFCSKIKNSNQPFPKNIHNKIPCTRNQVSLILQKSDISKSRGLDGIRILILKQLSNSLSFLLHSFFKTCLNKGKIPSQWKKRLITTIYKDG